MDVGGAVHTHARLKAKRMRFCAEKEVGLCVARASTRGGVCTQLSLVYWSYDPPHTVSSSQPRPSYTLPRTSEKERVSLNMWGYARSQETPGIRPQLSQNALRMNRSSMSHENVFVLFVYSSRTLNELFTKISNYVHLTSRQANRSPYTW